MNTKGFYVALLAAFAIAVIAGTIILSTSSAKTEKSEFYAKEIPEVKRVWQKARQLLDDQANYLLYVQKCTGNFAFNEGVINANIHKVTDKINDGSEFTCNATALSVTGSSTYTITYKLNCERVFGAAADPEFRAFFENNFFTVKTVVDQGLPTCKIIDEQSGKVVYPI